jgi:hypothetical protein
MYDKIHGQCEHILQGMGTIRKPVYKLTFKSFKNIFTEC